MIPVCTGDKQQGTLVLCWLPAMFIRGLDHSFNPIEESIGQCYHVSTGMQMLPTNDQGWTQHRKATPCKMLREVRSSGQPNRTVFTH